MGEESFREEALSGATGAQDVWEGEHKPVRHGKAEARGALGETQRCPLQRTFAPGIRPCIPAASGGLEGPPPARQPGDWGRGLSSVLARVGTPIHPGHLSEMPAVNPILPFQARSSCPGRYLEKHLRNAGKLFRRHQARTQPTGTQEGTVVGGTRVTRRAQRRTLVPPAAQEGAKGSSQQAHTGTPTHPRHTRRHTRQTGCTDTHNRHGTHTQMHPTGCT